jgi:hypothetical protein
MTFREEELIAYHLGELSWWKQKLLRRRLETDPQLAAESEEIAATLKAFSSDPEPVASAAVLDRSWQRVRSSLTVLDTPPRFQRPSVWTAAWISAIAIITIVALIAIPRRHAMQTPVATVEQGLAPARSLTQQLLGELHKERPAAASYNHRPGPLTTAPVDAVAEDPALAAHLDAAERVLTEVSHTDGPLQPETREQVHRLLLENAVYHQSAEQHGDMETAAVVDDLGRVLISLDAEPLDPDKARHATNPDAFHLEMNLGGVLFDLRILHHNDNPTTEQ